MRKQHIRIGQVVLLLGLSLTSVACGSSKKSTSGGIDLTKDAGSNTGGDAGGSDGSTNGATDAGATGGNNNGGKDGGATTGGGDAGPTTGPGGCILKPKSPTDFLNSCPRAGVDSRDFDNSKRLPADYRNPVTLPALP